MKKFGEITSCENGKASVRIYKEKNGDWIPTSLMVSPSTKGDYSVGDMVEIDINMFLFNLSTLIGYILPFFATSLAFFIIRPFTDNIIIIESVILTTLFLTYFLADHLTKSNFFQSYTVCKIISIIEE